MLTRVEHRLQQGIEVLGQSFTGSSFVLMQRDGTALSLLEAHSLLDDGLQHLVPEQLTQLRQTVLVFNRAWPVTVHDQT